MTATEPQPHLCRSEYVPPSTQGIAPGARIVRCNLWVGHGGDHDELIDGELGVVSWPPQPEVTLDDLGPYDPVEQAARALHEHDRLERDPPIPGLGPEPPWEELAEVHRESYRKVVRPALEAALSSLPASMTRPVEFATDDDEGELRLLYPAEALAAAEARGWLKAATALRNKPGGEDWPLIAADWLVEHAFDQSTGGQP